MKPMPRRRRRRGGGRGKPRTGPQQAAACGSRCSRWVVGWLTHSSALERVRHVRSRSQRIQRSCMPWPCGDPPQPPTCPVGQVGPGPPWSCEPPISVALNGLPAISHGSITVLTGSAAAEALVLSVRGAAGSASGPRPGLVDGWRYTFTASWGTYVVRTASTVCREGGCAASCRHCCWQ